MEFVENLIPLAVISAPQKPHRFSVYFSLNTGMVRNHSPEGSHNETLKAREALSKSSQEKAHQTRRQRSEYYVHSSGHFPNCSESRARSGFQPKIPHQPSPNPSQLRLLPIN